MNAQEKKAWEIWIDYCRKLDKWYKANPDKVAEHEPVLMTPPFDAIVESNLAADAELKRLSAQLCAANKGLKAVETLINESHGVDGLHLNGDVAPWDELRTGGSFGEWLNDFDTALSSSAPCPHEEEAKRLREIVEWAIAASDDISKSINSSMVEQFNAELRRKKEG